ADPGGTVPWDEPMRVHKRGASYVLSLRLPFVERGDLNVFRRADELYIRVGSYKRNLALPQTLQRLDVKEAAFVEDRLEVRFAREGGDRAAATAGGGQRGTDGRGDRGGGGRGGAAQRPAPPPPPP